MKKKIIHNSKRCPDCNHTVRWARSDNLWKCLRCPSEFTDAELKSKKPYSDEPDYIETSPVLQMFNKPAAQVMAPAIPIATPAPVAVALVLQETAKLPELANLQEFAAGAEGILKKILTKEKIAADLVVDKVWTPSSDGEQSFDVNELFVYHPKVEVKTSPPRMAMPTLQVSARRAEAPTFDTGRQVYSLRSER